MPLVPILMFFLDQLCAVRANYLVHRLSGMPLVFTENRVDGIAWRPLGAGYGLVKDHANDECSSTLGVRALHSVALKSLVALPIQMTAMTFPPLHSSSCEDHEP